MRKGDPNKERSIVFCHSKVDEYGLTPSQFRLLYHISRRQGTGIAGWASWPEIARVCRMDDKTCRAAGKVLQSYNMITRLDRSGKSIFFSLTPDRDWLPSPGVTKEKRKGGRPSSKVANPPQNTGEVTPPNKQGETPPKIRGDHPPQNTGDEGIPSEGIPSKEENPSIKFSPLPKNLWRSEYEKMLREAEKELERIKEKRGNWEWILAADVQDNITWLSANATDANRAEYEARISKYKDNQANYVKGAIKLEMAGEFEAWKARIKEIKAAMAGATK